MHALKTLTIGVVATLAIAFAPTAKAQNLDEIQLRQTFLDIVTQYYDVIEATYDISSDSEKAAILQMQKIQEVYEQRGDKAQSVEVLREVLENTDNQTIRNAAYIMLGDTLKESGRASEAIEILRRGLEENIKAAD